MLQYKPYMVLVQYSPMHWKMAKNDQWLLLCGHYPRLRKIDKEVLAFVWGTKHFHQYLWEVRFSLETDHKSLVSIFCHRPQ